MAVALNKRFYSNEREEPNRSNHSEQRVFTEYLDTVVITSNTGSYTESEEESEGHIALGF